jgi:hypothetical protein
MRRECILIGVADIIDSNPNSNQCFGRVHWHYW